MFTISENEKLLSSCKIASKDVKDATSSSEKIGLLETPTADDISLSDPLPNTATAPPSSAKLPQSDATVQEVRAFIAATFVANHGTTAEYAQKTAQKWMLGRGWCLRELPSVRFTEIFGDVIGPHLAWDVKHGKEEERAAIRAKKTAADDFEMQRVTNIALVGLCLALAIFVYTASMHYAVAVITFFHICILAYLAGEAFGVGVFF